MTSPLQDVGGGWLDQAISAMAQLPSRIMSTVEEWRERDMIERELGELGAHGELDRVLADVGLARADIPALIKNGPAAARQLGEMMERIGIGAAHRSSLTRMRDIEWLCTICSSRRACRRWLASGASDDGFHAFCPNADMFEQARHGRKHGGVLAELIQLKGQLL
jgi:uncharacterized protein YjiS (DUF1127 family)